MASHISSGGAPQGTFVAIDFETADYGRDSACQVGLVRVDAGQITCRESRLIRPPRRDFVFTYIHGIAWKDVALAPRFAEVWTELCPILDGAEFLVAHNAAFDRAVLRACCSGSDLPVPVQRFECTVSLARTVLGIYPTTLPDVCRHLRLKHTHHDALSDAEACARIVIAARKHRRATLFEKSRAAFTAARSSVSQVRKR